MSHPYTTSPSDIFTPFHLKYAIPRQLAVLLIAYGYSFIKINLGNHDLANLANDKATKKLKHPQCLIHNHLLIWTQFAHSNLQQTMGTIHFQRNDQLKVKHNRTTN
ncbi:hypothetical protein CMV_006393 [Castanea mollissima]|uniref:Uncharacterized protein n=1 Tax=Castanea mollissima TaxID=60419 RepID=A0A8J4W3L6_9ROSI|nr:hypothetical protein CMV_006393 [Castanea mollissima]